MNFLIHKKEQPYFILSLIISIPLYALLFFSGIGILLLAFLIFTPLFAHWMMLGHIRTNGVKITPSQFPYMYEAAAKLSEKMQVSRVPDIYIIESGGILNAFATRFFGKNMIVLYSDVVNLIKDHDEEKLYYIIAHELAHIKRNHIVKQLLILPANWVPFLSSAYSRTCEYTCDHMAAYYTNDVEAARQALVILAVGPRLYKNVNVYEYQLESSKEKGITVWLAEKLSTHPPLPKRMHYLETKFNMPTDIVFKPSRATVLLGMIIAAALIGVFILTAVGIKELIHSPLMHMLDPYTDIDPFLGAAANGNYEELETLYKEGHNVNVQDEYGWNALHYAVSSDIYSEEELKDLVQSLLEMGVDPNVRDEDNSLPADIAEDMGYPETADMLRNAVTKQDNL